MAAKNILHGLLASNSAVCFGLSIAQAQLVRQGLNEDGKVQFAQPNAAGADALAADPGFFATVAQAEGGCLKDAPPPLLKAAEMTMAASVFVAWACTLRFARAVVEAFADGVFGDISRYASNPVVAALVNGARSPAIWSILLMAMPVAILLAVKEGESNPLMNHFPSPVAQWLSSAVRPMMLFVLFYVAAAAGSGTIRELFGAVTKQIADVAKQGGSEMAAATSDSKAVVDNLFDAVVNTDSVVAAAQAIVLVGLSGQKGTPCGSKIQRNVAAALMFFTGVGVVVNAVKPVISAVDNMRGSGGEFGSYLG